MNMANMHLVTGYGGKGHITAEDHGAFNAAIFGTGQYVLPMGSMFAATVITNNQIRVAGGELLIQGRHGRLDESGYVDLAIDNGSQDMLRNDLIVARYTKESDTGVEECNLVVIKGTAVASNPVDPEYTTGDILYDHVLVADMPLYRVPLNGLNVQELVPLFSKASILADGSVSTEKLVDGAVTTEKLGSDVKASLNEKARKSTIVTATLAAASWSGNTYTLALSGITAKSNQEILPGLNITTEQLEALQGANIQDGGQASGSMTLKAFGDVPTIDIPIRVIVRGDM